MAEEKAHDFPARGVALVLVAAIVFLGATLGAIWWLYPGAHPGEATEISVFPEPILEIEPVEQYRDWLADQLARLDGAGGRVPIGEAMEAVAARGAAAFEPVAVP